MIMWYLRCKKPSNLLIIGTDINVMKEVRLERSHDISKSINSYKTQDIGLTLVEGGKTRYVNVKPPAYC